MPISVLTACLFILLFQIDSKLSRAEKERDELKADIQHLKTEITKSKSAF
jgi:hypothetical protein